MMQKKPQTYLAVGQSVDRARGRMYCAIVLIQYPSFLLPRQGAFSEHLPSQPRSAPHSRLRAILDPLETQWHFVQVKSRGRNSEVSLTEQGNSALRIFGTGV